MGWIRRGQRTPETAAQAAERRTREQERLLEETEQVEAMIAGLHARARVMLRQEAPDHARKP